VLLIPRLSLIMFLLSFMTSVEARAVQSFEETIERDIPQKKSLPIYLQHRLGNVSIQGWVQDRIRVTIKKRVLSDSEALAKKEFQKLDLVSLQTSDAFEIRVGHTQGVDLVSKMKDEAQTQVQVDLEIKAPYQSDLTVVLGDGKTLKLQEWRGGVKVTGKNDKLEFNKLLLSQPIYVNCIQCETDVRESKMEGHLLIGSKSILLNDVDGKNGLSIDSGTEEVKIENSRGNINVHTKSGRLTATKYEGTLRFQSVDGGAYINQFSGELSVQTQTGQVMVDIDQSSSVLDLDTEKSDIQVSLLPAFSGGLDLMSLRGEIVVQFPYDAKKSAVETYGPASPGRIEGTVGADQKIRVHAYSKQGGVRILRKAITR
jgi:hypothetical protein